MDWHTVASQVIGENEFGHPIFDTQRSEIGEVHFMDACPPDVVEYLNKKINLEDRVRTATQSSLGF